VTPLAAPLSGPVRVEKDRLPILCPTAIDDRVREVLDRVDGLAVLADQQSEVAAREGGGERLLVLLDREPGVHADLADDSPQQLANRRGEFALLNGLGGPIGIAVHSDGRDHPSRSKADAEQSALTLG